MWFYLYKEMLRLWLYVPTTVLKLYHGSKINWCPEKTIDCRK